MPIQLGQWARGGLDQVERWTGIGPNHGLSWPKPSLKLYCDACDYAIGAILVQIDENGIEWPIQYVSKQLHGTQLSWPVIETRRSENDDTPQPLDQRTNSPFIGQQVGNWSICHTLWPIRKPIVHPRLYPTHISFIPSQSKLPFLKYGYSKFDLENTRSRSGVRSKF